jgi:hypothetical protein
MFTKKNILSCLLAALAITPHFCLPTTVTLFSHGIADTWKQVNWYIKSYLKHDVRHYNDRVTIHTPFISFNYPDATNRFHRVNYNETSFGGKNEIRRLYKAYQKTNERFGQCDIILYGLSRGASNIVILAGTHQLDNVKALILESPYLTMAEVIAHMMTRRGLDWLPLSYGETIAEYTFRKYTRHGNSPDNCLKNIPQEMPIFIICSKEDHLVPASSSINLYKKLIESGHQHTYIFIADHGRHAAILKGPDGEKYEWIINAFYKKYNLPYCASSAEKGNNLLDLCQPQFD